MKTNVTAKTRPTRTWGARLAAATLAAVASAALTGVAVATDPYEPGANLGNLADRGTARVMGMDATYVGVADGADSLQWNPAGLGNMKDLEAGWHHVSALGNAIGESIIVGVPVGGLGGLAVSADFLDSGRFEQRDSLGNLTGHYDAGTIGCSVGWGYALMDDIAVGATVRGAQQTLASDRNLSFAGDVGVLWRAFSPLTLGVAVANLGASGSGSSLVTAIRAGASWTREFGANNHLLLAAATEIQPGGLNQMNVGAEDVLFSRLALRAGYRFNLADQELTGLTGLTAGAGIMFAHFALDYAYLPFGDLGNFQRVSLTYRQPAKPKKQPVQAVAQPVQAPVEYVQEIKYPEAAPTLIPIIQEITYCGFDCNPLSSNVLLITLFDDKTRFDFDQDIVKPEGVKHLAKLAEILNRYPDSTLRVDGYSDSLGTPEVKQSISQRRADRVAEVLKEKGVDAKRFEYVEGRSDTQPIVDNAINAGRPTNRRVELRVRNLKAK
jgi:outer membrane protein OmpA-like peptidoglycan-associated protein